MLPHQRYRARGHALSELRLRGEPLAPHPEHLIDLLERAAGHFPERNLLVDDFTRGRGGARFTALTFARAAEASRAVAGGLRARGASPKRPIVLTARNGTMRALALFGAWRAGIPVVVSGPYAGDEEVRALARFAGAAATLDAADVGALAASRPAADAPRDPDAVAQLVPYGERDGAPLLATTTHGNVCAMLAGLAQRWPFLAERPAVLVDRRRWSGFGVNVVLGLALRWAGEIFVEPSGGDAGVRETIAPTIAFDVPAGWTAWLARLRADDDLRRRWTARLRIACWTGAPLAPETRDGLRALGVPLGAVWGATTTASVVAATTEREPSHAALGAPLPGVELKLVPQAHGYEARVRGPQVMPGFWWRPDATAAAFDEDGFLRLYDLVRPLDRGAPERGLVSDGRSDGALRLGTGRSVDAAAVRTALLRACEDLADAEVVALGEDGIAALVVAQPGARVPAELLRAEIVAALRPAGALRALLVDAGMTPSQRRTALARLRASEPDAEVIVA